MTDEMEMVRCPRCGGPVDLESRRCPVDGFEVDSSHVLAVATTIEPTSGVPSRRSSLPASEDLTGKKLGRYVIESLLGRGGMATVWRAVHEELGGAVAIKVLDKRIIDTDDAQERFLREAKVSAQLNHEHVVKVIDFARDPSVGSYIVMELLTGKPLDRILADSGPLEEARAIAIALQITDALATAHALGIVHRDLKPGNVFVGRALGTEAVKVVDFGIAKLSIEKATALTRPGKLFGTPLYMSPEQWDNADVGPASDIYSLGVVLYEMLTGRLPISGSVMTEMAKNVALATPRSLRSHRPSISAALDGVVLRCLAKEAPQRFASMAELAHALREAQRTPSRSVSVTGAHGIASNKRSAIIFGVVAVLGIAGGWVYASSRGRITHASHPGDAAGLPSSTSLAAITTSPPPASALPPPSATETVPPPALSVATPTPTNHRVRLPAPRNAGRDAGAKPSAREDDDLLRKN